jgi:CopG antitoxin of type II toxin-antitoxin system
MTKKTKKQSKTKRDPLPEHFASLEEAAEFWDTHDSADYDEYFVGVDFDVDLKKRTLQIDGTLYDRLKVIAKKKRIPTNELLNRWIEEKLRSAA